MRMLAAFAGSVAFCVGLAACGAAPDASENQVEANAVTASAPQAAKTSGAPAPSAGQPAIQDLDFAALEDREDPDRVLRFYANAIQTGRWDAAAAAWSKDAEVSPDTLRERYGASKTRLAIGKGDVEGAAGTLYYEAPITAQGADGESAERGTIVLRRANDVPGASEEQLNWRIERSTLILKR